MAEAQILAANGSSKASAGFEPRSPLPAVGE